MMKKDISSLEIGNKIIECLEVSQNAMPLEKSEFNKNLVLEISGIKSQTKFNKLYKYLLCEEKDNKFFLIDKKNNKEFVFDKENIIGLGNQVCKILSENLNPSNSNVFALKTVNKNCIAFLIDNGYSDFTESDTKQRWQQMYGTLIEFEFHSVSDLPEKIQVRGKTKSEMIISHILKDGEGMLEVLDEICNLFTKAIANNENIYMESD